MNQSDTAVTERADNQKKPRRIRWWFWASMLSLAGLVILAFSMYWFSAPMSWPFNWPGQPSSAEERLQGLEDRLVTHVGSEVSTLNEKIDGMAERLATLERTVASGETVSGRVSDRQDALIEDQTRLSDQVVVFRRELEQLQASVLSLRSELTSLSRSSDTELQASFSEDLGWLQLREFLYEAQRALALEEVEVAMLAYSNATAWIEESQSSSYDELLRILAREKSALESWDPLPWSNYEQAVMAIQMNVASWPTPSDPLDSKAPVSAAAAESQNGWLSKLATKAKEVVIVRPREPVSTQVADRRLGPQLLAERFEWLQLALVRRDMSSVRSQASLLLAQLANSYDIGHPEVSAAMTLLTELSVIEQEALPEIVGSARMMVEQRLSGQ